MDKDTPLPDVVNYLPLEVAILLDKFPPNIQELAVTACREAICFFEEMNCHLDPLQFEVVIAYIANSSAMAGVAMTETVEKVIRLVEEHRAEA